MVLEQVVQQGGRHSGLVVNSPGFDSQGRQTGAFCVKFPQPVQRHAVRLNGQTETVSCVFVSVLMFRCLVFSHVCVPT